MHSPMPRLPLIECFSFAGSLPELSTVGGLTKVEQTFSSSNVRTNGWACLIMGITGP